MWEINKAHGKQTALQQRKETKCRIKVDPRSVGQMGALELWRPNRKHTSPGMWSPTTGGKRKISPSELRHKGRLSKYTGRKIQTGNTTVKRWNSVRSLLKKVADEEPRNSCAWCLEAGEVVPSRDCGGKETGQERLVLQNPDMCHI